MPLTDCIPGRKNNESYGMNERGARSTVVCVRAPSSISRVSLQRSLRENSCVLDFEIRINHIVLR